MTGAERTSHRNREDISLSIHATRWPSPESGRGDDVRPAARRSATNQPRVPAMPGRDRKRMSCAPFSEKPADDLRRACAACIARAARVHNLAPIAASCHPVSRTGRAPHTVQGALQTDLRRALRAWRKRCDLRECTFTSASPGNTPGSNLMNAVGLCFSRISLRCRFNTVLGRASTPAFRPTGSPVFDNLPSNRALPPRLHLLGARLVHT